MEDCVVAATLEEDVVACADDVRIGVAEVVADIWSALELLVELEANEDELLDVDEIPTPDALNSRILLKP